MATILYWQDDETGETEFVQFDAVRTEAPEDVLAITSHPVEQGADVTDHAREEPTRLSIEAFVSNIPNPAIDDDVALETVDLRVPTMADPGTKTIDLDVPGSPLQPSLTGLLQAGVQAISNAISGPNHRATVRGDIRRQILSARASVYRQTSPRNRVRDVYDALLKAQSRKLLVTAQTAHREYFDMMLERVAKPRALEDGSGSQFQIDLRRIRVAASETVQSPKPAEARGQVPKSAGSQATKSAAQPEELQSVLDSGLTAMGI